MSFCMGPGPPAASRFERRANSDPKPPTPIELDDDDGAQKLRALVRVPSMELMETISPVTSSSDLQKRRSSLGGGHPVGRWAERDFSSPGRTSPPPKQQRSTPSTGGAPRKQRVRPDHNDGDYEWLRRRLCNGEAVTCLSLAGNYAVMIT